MNFLTAEIVLNKNSMLLGTIIETKIFQQHFRKAGCSGMTTVFEIRMLTQSLSAQNEAIRLQNSLSPLTFPSALSRGIPRSPWWPSRCHPAGVVLWSKAVPQMPAGRNSGLSLLKKKAERTKPKLSVGIDFVSGKKKNSIP